MKLTFEIVENAFEADSADVLDSVTDDDDDADGVKSVLLALLVADDDALRLTNLAPEMQRRITYRGTSERCNSDALQERTNVLAELVWTWTSEAPLRLVSGSAELLLFKFASSRPSTCFLAKSCNESAPQGCKTDKS